jgi:hypothetical protein
MAMTKDQLKAFAAKAAKESAGARTDAEKRRGGPALFPSIGAVKKPGPGVIDLSDDDWLHELRETKPVEE